MIVCMCYSGEGWSPGALAGSRTGDRPPTAADTGRR